ncbi:hypothetical protein P6F26_12700 [Roseibacterium sp. SDUM158017]|uniref:hypothetical protein n=1 Tax=Roseicyclus salinarum TaxID=3036773 RepID=UPI0024156C23|nr:hypothetical protein [Roseibacterium sp. SDUM158017]MDG4649306.1 hypothetical protein [Roseibacterium sp. SDUM158017]
MKRTHKARMASCAALVLALAACGPGPVPNDVGQGVGFSDYAAYQARREALRSPPPQTVAPPADASFAAAPAGARSTDIAGMASAAIAEAEGGPPVAASADDFTAPPLPEGMSVLGANVVAFALSTSHPVGQRVWARFPLRLGRPEVRCSDFRTTDLAQDWFLENEGPERDRAGLDPDGDGFACNWDPERYRAEARAARMPQAARPPMDPQATDG